MPELTSVLHDLGFSFLSVVAAAGMLAFIASVAFSRLSGRSAFASMWLAVVVVVGLASGVLLVVTLVTRRLSN